MRLSILLLTILLVSMGIRAQFDSSLMSLLDEQESGLPRYVEATFKTTRIINGHSIESPHKGVLEFRISHRFGTINRGFYDLFGLDQATMKMNFDYGITRFLSVGVGRSTFEKSYDGFVKLKLLRQTSEFKVPITAVLVSGSSINTLEWTEPDRKNYCSSRVNYFHQLLLARKLTEGMSLQVAPTLVHRNLVLNSEFEDNDVYALGFGIRQKLNARTSFNIEYFRVLSGTDQSQYNNSLSIGVDIETGGHVFQLHFTNSNAMIEKAFIARTTGSWLHKGIHFGFNLSRVFTIN